MHLISSLMRDSRVIFFFCLKQLGALGSRQLEVLGPALLLVLESLGPQICMVFI